MNGGPINWSSGDVHGQIYRYVIAPPVPERLRRTASSATCGG